MAQRRQESYWDNAYVAEQPIGRHAARNVAAYRVQAQPFPRENIPVYPKPPEHTVPQRSVVPPLQEHGALDLRKLKVHFSIGRLTFAGLAFIVLMAMICMNLVQWSEVSDAQRQIDNMKRRIANMQEDNSRLEDDIKYTMDGEKIRTYAVNKMGMRPPSEEQTRYITLEGFSTQTAP